MGNCSISRAAGFALFVSILLTSLSFSFPIFASQGSLSELENKLKLQYATIEEVIAAPPRRIDHPADYAVVLRAWQDRLAGSFSDAAATVEEIIRINPANTDVWRERLETLQVYGKPTGPPGPRTVFGGGEVKERARVLEAPKAIYTDEARAANTLLAVDRSFLLAVIAAAFVAIHGLQGDFDRDVEEKIEHAMKQSSQPGQAEISKKPPSREIDIPLLGVKAQLSDAAVVAMLLYWVFLLRAALLVHRVGLLASRLRELDQPVLNALLLYPSLATASLVTRVLACLSVGALGWCAEVMWLLPRNQITRNTVPNTLAGAAIIMLPPAAILCWQLLALRGSTAQSSNAA